LENVGQEVYLHRSKSFVGNRGDEYLGKSAIRKKLQTCGKSSARKGIHGAVMLGRFVDVATMKEIGGKVKNLWVLASWASSQKKRQGERGSVS